MVLATPPDPTDAEVVAKLLGAVEALPPRDLTMVRLRFWDGMSWQQIAEAFGFSRAADAESYWDDVVAPILRDRLESE